MLSKMVNRFRYLHLSLRLRIKGLTKNNQSLSEQFLSKGSSIPPNQGNSLTRLVLAPRRAAWIAATVPPVPPLTIKTSVVYSSQL